MKAGANADLLIHEATFEAALHAEAVAKAHCTLAEAFAVARDMRARTALFTHFSQRYPGLSGADSSASSSDTSAGGWKPERGEFGFAWAFAFDGMQWHAGMDARHLEDAEEAIRSAMRQLDAEDAPSNPTDFSRRLAQCRS